MSGTLESAVDDYAAAWSRYLLARDAHRVAGDTARDALLHVEALSQATARALVALTDTRTALDDLVAGAT